MVDKTIIEDSHDDVTPKESDSDRPALAQTIFESVVDGDDDPATGKEIIPPATIMEDAACTSVPHQRHADRVSLQVPQADRLADDSSCTGFGPWTTTGSISGFDY